MTNQGLDQLNRLANEVGNFIQYWGFKKIHGKVWTHLYLSSVPLDAADLMDRLKISKSLVSITINDLLQYKVIEKDGKGPKDTCVYVCNPDVKAVILDVLKNRESQMLDKVQDEFSQFKKTPASSMTELLNGQRLESLENMIDEAQIVLKAITDMKDCDFSSIKLC